MVTSSTQVKVSVLSIVERIIAGLVTSGITLLIVRHC